MNWVTTRSIIIGTSIVSAALLLGLLGGMGFNAMTHILGTQFTYGQACGAIAAFTAIMFIGRYV